MDPLGVDARSGNAPAAALCEEGCCCRFLEDGPADPLGTEDAMLMLGVCMEDLLLPAELGAALLAENCDKSAGVAAAAAGVREDARAFSSRDAFAVSAGGVTRFFFLIER